MEKLDKDFRFMNGLLLRQMEFKGPEGMEDADEALVGAGRAPALSGRGSWIPDC
jgi:hypothetical protein